MHSATHRPRRLQRETSCVSRGRPALPCVGPSHPKCPVTHCSPTHGHRRALPNASIVGLHPPTQPELGKAGPSAGLSTQPVCAEPKARAVPTGLSYCIAGSGQHGTTMLSIPSFSSRVLNSSTKDKLQSVAFF